MDMLSSACGLTKASFYHHYPNKEALLRDVLEWTHQRLAETLFSIAYDPLLTPRERLEKLGRKAARLFQDDSIGCLMGVVAVDASYGRSELMAPIRSFLDDWAQASPSSTARPSTRRRRWSAAGNWWPISKAPSCWRASMASRAISMASPGERWSNWRASLRPPST